MDARFRDREEWQQLCSAATSEGWLISPDQVMCLLWQRSTSMCRLHGYNPRSLTRPFASQVDKQEVIGQGSFGVTYMGTYDKTKVAVKCVRIEREVDATTFLRETSALARLRHPNIMAFIGEDQLPSASICQILHKLAAVDA